MLTLHQWEHPRRFADTQGWVDACWNAERVRVGILAGEIPCERELVLKNADLFVGLPLWKEFQQEVPVNRAAALIFDTETTGGSKTDQVIQLGYVIIDAAGTVLDSMCEFLATDVDINPHAYKVHGISDGFLRRNGKPGAPIITRFLHQCAAVAAAGGKIVAHNMVFDKGKVLATAERLGVGMSFPAARHLFCTMKGVKARSTAERGGNGKNADVWKFLFPNIKVKFQLHDALGDAQMTAMIYTEGLRKGWWGGVYEMFSK